jgi:hypothetical protein
MIRMWFERRFGTSPARVDATGRPAREDRIVARSGGGCPVPVRAHARKGGRIEVEAHCRATPAA